MKGFVNENIRLARAWWDGRTAREHVMLAVLGAVLAIVLVWFGVISPLLAWREGAETRLERAVQTRALVAAAAGLDAAGRPAPPAAQVETLLAESASEAGVEVQLQAEGAGVSFSVESAETARLFGWIATLERSHGLTIDSLSVLENADATLQAQGVVAAGGAA